MDRLVQEYRVFAECPREMRLLLIGDCIYAFVLPVIEIFVAAYVLRATQDSRSVLLYQACVYIATPAAFVINGYLLQWIRSQYMYAMGMFSSGICLLLLTSGGASTWRLIVVCGACMGLATGLFWANRGLLAVASTNDGNRNYFYGVETAALTLTSVLVPWGAGVLLERRSLLVEDGARSVPGYRILAVIAIILTTVAAIVVASGRFRGTSTQGFLSFRFQRLWYWLLALAGLRGVTQGYIVTAPALLILRMVGREGTLGRIEAIGGCVTALLAYWLGRYSRPRHRVGIFASGALLFWIGSLATGIWFSRISVLAFMACLIVAKPMIDLAYGPIEFRTIDVVSRAEKRGTYTYIMSHEIGVLAGRVVGCSLFLAVGFCFSEAAALRYALPIVASLQLPAILVARQLPL